MERKFHDYVRSAVSEARYVHSVGTADTARELALRFGADPDQAYLAGLLHDIARESTGFDLVCEAKRQGIMVSEVEDKLPFLLHGKVAAERARSLGVTDEGVLSAIASHVTGKKGWARLDQIVYLADKIEPGRDYPGVDAVRESVSIGDFRDALIRCLQTAISYARQSGSSLIDLETVVVLDEVSKK